MMRQKIGDGARAVLCFDHGACGDGRRTRCKNYAQPAGVVARNARTVQAVTIRVVGVGGRWVSGGEG